MTPSSLREIPTVTVFAWCLMASTGRVSSSMARVSDSTRSSTRAPGEPTLPVLSWYASTGRSERTSRSRPGQLHRGARLEVAVVAVVAHAVAVLGHRAGDPAPAPSSSTRVGRTIASAAARSTTSMTSRSGRADASIASAAS